MSTVPPEMQRSLADFTQQVAPLAQPAAFPFATPSETAHIVQTHSSVVFLLEHSVYKLKKPKNFGFVDYASLEARRHFCQEEVRLNARLAPHVYLGIAPVIVSPEGVRRFGMTMPADTAPLPGIPLDGGTILDYAVVMRRLSAAATLAAHVQDGTVTAAMVASVARRMAAFHCQLASNEQITAWGDPGTVAANWEENLAQMLPFVDVGELPMLTNTVYQGIASFARSFLEHHEALLRERQRAGYIREGHGDLRLEHIYLLSGPSVDDAVTIIDCVEFAARYRCGDVCSEMAFLAMELDAAGRSDLSRIALDVYCTATNDSGLKELLPFYECYRACVRGKVQAMTSLQQEVSAGERDRAWQAATSLFRLAAYFAHAPVQPMLIMIGGLMGTGKSTLAAVLHHEQGWPILSSDVVRKRLASMDVDPPIPAAFGRGIYTDEWSTRVYAMLCVETLATFQRGHSVIVDASFIRQADRRALVEAAQHQHARVIMVTCVCPRAVTHERLSRRWLAHITGDIDPYAVSAASDGRPEIIEAQTARQEAVQLDQERLDAYAVIETTLPLAQQLEIVWQVIKMPHLACWLIR